jgi:enoyl-CoA hydratase/carnithine racemase
MSLIQITREGPVTILTLDRAESMNPLGAPGDGDAFVTVANAINRDMECRVVILTGAGRAFSAGGDIKAMRDKTGTFGGTTPAISDGYRDNIHLMLRALYGLRVPLIAAVNGPAIGLGCDVACLADIRIASEAAKFGVTFLKLGIIPGDGGTWILPRCRVVLHGRRDRCADREGLGPCQPGRARRCADGRGARAGGENRVAPAPCAAPHQEPAAAGPASEL